MGAIMRGYLQPGTRPIQTEHQAHFTTFSRHRRTKIAKAASTTLVKAHQWARAEAVEPELAKALEAQVLAQGTKKKK
jgi:hypothetical protein